MQKRLLGMAVAAALTAPAVALAQVQVYGTANLTFNSVKYSDSAPNAAGASTPSVSKMAVNSHSSNFGIRSSETLGGGMTGWVQYEFNTQMERNNDPTSGNGTPRNSAIGLRGNFGNVYMGTWETPYTSTFRMWDVGSIGGYGPTTSVAYRRESTGSSPSQNCNNALPGAAGGAFNTPTTLCQHADGAGGGTGVPAGYALWRRYGSAVFYDSPSFSGFAFRIAYQPNETKSAASPQLASAGLGGTAVVTENPSSWSASLAWTGMGGKARAFIANASNKDWSRTGETDDGYVLGGGYDFGFVNVGVYMEQFTYNPNVAVAGVATPGEFKAKGYGLGLAVPLGSGKIGASYAIQKDFTGGGCDLLAAAPPAASTGAACDNGGKMYNIGYEWNLSKRTVASFGYAAIKNDDNAAYTWTGMPANQTGYATGVLNGSDPSTLYVGLRHSF
jgi:predicted porin